MSSPTIGVLALQGAFRRHRYVLDRCGVRSVEVRRPADLAGIDALVLPGGESTTMSMLLERAELFEPIDRRLRAGMPAFGTCAGMILLGAQILDGRPDQRSFAAIDIDVRRNAYGRQVDSFDTEISVDWPGFEAPECPFPASFVRAPGVERVGADVAVLARVDDRPVLCGSGSILVASFHPELSDDRRIHQRFLEEVS